MIVSVWRYSHFCLAVSSFLLLTLAALTGIILAFETISERAQGGRVDQLDTITLAHAIPVLKEKIQGLQELSVNEYGFVTARYADGKGHDQTAYVNPSNGLKLGIPKKQPPFFEWTTTLHRSLFLHETGRLIVGIVAFLLILVALSGIGLVVQRQKGFKRFFALIEKTSFAQYYHTVFGRLSLIFILAIAVTGTYLSVSRFVIKPARAVAKVDDSNIKEDPRIALKDFPVFRQTMLSDVQTIHFPFSDFPEDYFTLRLKDREVCVNQFTGGILAQQVYPKSYTLASFSLRWHTGRSNVAWAIVLAVTSGYILFFIYSGLWISWKRTRNRSRNRFKPEDCKTILLVGSENGSTYRFAISVYKQLLQQGEKVYLADLDTYGSYPDAEQLVVMTSTYGEGDPPSNAKKFLKLLDKNPQRQKIRFSVLGFGSRSYPHFCRFAKDVEEGLCRQSWAIPLMDLATVDEKSPQDFSNWLSVYTKLTGKHLRLSKELLSTHLNKPVRITVTEKTETGPDNTFLVRMKTKGFKKMRSGDLLAIYPQNDHRQRLYSIGKVNNEILLSVKLQEQGLGSNYLYALRPGETIKACIVKNKHFHFPKKVSQVVMVSNGTGIVPFLGMLSENKRKLPCTLYCGFRESASFQLYKSLLDENIVEQQLRQYRLALSREGERLYVSHLLEKDSHFVGEVLGSGGVIMLCGSLSMQKDVLAAIDHICQNNHLESMETYQDNNKIVMDCY